MPSRDETRLLSEIEVGALDDSIELATLLRKCIALGGATGSERLREWAARELKGYEEEDELPPCRSAPPPPLLLDGATTRARISGQLVPATMIPEFALDTLDRELNYTSGVAELAQLVESARARGESFVAVAPPGVELLVPLVNQELRKADQSGFGGSYPFATPPSQVVERLYREVPLSTLIGILDVVRTTLVELVAEMRAGAPDNGRLPSRDIVEQAVDVAIYGKKNRVLINQVSPNSQGPASLGGWPPPQVPLRKGDHAR